MAATNLDRSLVRHWPSGGLLKQSSSGYAATFVGVPVILATNGAAVYCRRLLPAQEPRGAGAVMGNLKPGVALRARHQQLGLVMDVEKRKSRRRQPSRR